MLLGANGRRRPPAYPRVFFYFKLIAIKTYEYIQLQVNCMRKKRGSEHQGDSDSHYSQPPEIAIRGYNNNVSQKAILFYDQIYEQFF